MRVAINGFGRIGRSVFRVITQRNSAIEIAALNDLATEEMEAYLLKYDTVMGEFPGPVEVVDSHLLAGGQRVKLLTEKDPGALPWAELGIDVVIEATGVFRDRAKVSKHLEAGAGRVILTVPSKDALDATIVLGVNDADLEPGMRLLSNASCTTNCLAPVAKVLDESFGIVRGVMTTVHAYTNDQRLADVPHKDFRRSRAATENIIPTSTGAAKAVAEVLPQLKGKLDGMAMRVPVPDGSTVDLVVEVSRPTTVDEVNGAIRQAAAGPMARIIEYSEAPLVSSDVIGNPHSAIFDAASTRVLAGNTVKVLAWYDNEWGYSNRVVDLIELLGALAPPRRA
ncbi:MAG TPA: type I glyceraldehyde-3-phosphate dehydrogenase [Acidimicrobiia bacterium]|nr:type I glyceraldehyde-3-phosphate dehydrogenase [Acidimicrobiia bacterium]